VSHPRRTVPEVLLPVTCPACGALGGAPCAPCAAELRPAPWGPPPLGVDRCAALVAYEGAGRALVTGLKYANRRGALIGLAAALADLAGPEGADAVTWPPTTPGRRRRRGFDQAELLARAVAARLGLPCPRLLVRRSGSAQSASSLDDRRRGPSLILRRASPARVLLVDDVVTTGGTLRRAAAVLRAGGAVQVEAVVVARTPLRAARAGALPSDLSYTRGVAHGSVVASRCQSQAKRPT
jgi:predicted amidophosphoribosyltransferase